jgi:hypothetical protein
VLMEKGLTKEGLSYCNRLLKPMVKKHRLREELALREMMRLAYKTFMEGDYAQETAYNNNRLKTLSDQLANLVQYQLARDQINEIVRRSTRPDSTTVLESMTKVMKHEILQNEKLALSFDAQLCFHSTWAMYHSALYEGSAAIEHNRKLVSLWEINPGRIVMDPHVYIAALSNLSGKLTTNGLAEQGLPIMKKILDLEVKNPNHKAFQFKEYHLQFQLYHLNTGNVLAVGVMGEVLNEGLKRFGRLISPGTQATLEYNLAIAQLLSGEYRLALKQFTSIIGTGKEPVRIDLQNSSMILRLLLFCWINGPDSLDSDLRTYRRYFKARSGSQLKTVVLSYVSACMDATSDQERKTLLANLVASAEELKAKRIQASEEVWLMAKSRLDDRPIMQLFQEGLSKE